MEKNNYKLTETIIGCCFEVHTTLGPGFNEKVYHNALIDCLSEHKLIIETEKSYNIHYKNKKVGSLRVGLIVNNKVII